MESCARVIGLLPQFIEGDGPDESAGRVSSHLLVCEACRRRAERQRKTLAALNALPLIIPPDDFRIGLMQRVRSHPIAIPRKAVRHLRLVRVFFWAAVLGVAALTLGAGAALLAKASFVKTSITDPTLLTEWLVAMGQFAFSLVLSVATRSDLPALFPAPRAFALWGGLLGSMVTLGATCLVAGLGILATARAVFRPRRR